MWSRLILSGSSRRCSQNSKSLSLSFLSFIPVPPRGAQGGTRRKLFGFVVFDFFDAFFRDGLDCAHDGVQFRKHAAGLHAQYFDATGLHPEIAFVIVISLVALMC